MSDSAWTSVVAHMRANNGLATRDDIATLGLPSRTLRRRVAAGLLVPVNSRVVALAGLPIDLRAQTRAVVLAQPEAIPTGPAAAAFLGSGPWQGTDLGDEPWFLANDLRGYNGRRITHPGARVVRVAGLDVTRASDAVVDLIRFWPRAEARHIAHRSLLLGTVTLDDLVAAHARLARLAGAAQLRGVIRDLADGTISEAERRLCELLREAEVAGWIANHRVKAGAGRYVIDVAFPEVRVAVEVDGRSFHSDARAFQRDRTRQNDLVRAGWTVLRFTWADITRRPDSVLHTIGSSVSRPRSA